MIRLLTLLVLVGMLFGCGPVYKTEYSYVPPKTPMGTMCISQCVQNKSICEQSCQIRNDNCRVQARQDSYYQYENYKESRYQKGKQIKKNLSDFDSSSSCDQSCDCSPSFNACYSACGGQVVKKQVCVAFCDKQ